MVKTLQCHKKDRYKTITQETLDCAPEQKQPDLPLMVREYLQWHR